MSDPLDGPRGTPPGGFRSAGPAGPAGSAGDLGGPLGVSSALSGRSFRAFLESMARLDAGPEEVALGRPREGGEVEAEPRVIEAPSVGGPKDIATILRDAGDLPLPALLRAPRDLIDFGLVQRSGQAADERFELSPSGTRTSRMMGLRAGKM